MAEHAQDAPMVTVYAVKATDAWVFRAVDTVENCMYLVGAPTKERGLIYAKELAREGKLVTSPVRRGSQPWAK
jgi:hypothetical protein